MIQPIMKDTFFLSLKVEPATLEDKQVAMDLLDTLKTHENECVGMAAKLVHDLRSKSWTQAEPLPQAI